MIADINRFVTEMNHNDMARSNLYMVILPSINNIIQHDDIIAGKPTSTIQKVSGTVNQVSNTIDLLSNPKQIFGATVTSGIHSMINGYSSSSLFSGISGDEALIAMMCKSVNLPGKSYEYEEDRLMRRSGHSVIRSLSKDNLTMTFYCTAQYKERRWFMSWFESIYNSDTSEVAFYDSYVRPIEILTLQRDGLPSTITHVIEAYPVRVGEVQLSYENNNEVASFDVEFKFKDIKYLDDINSAIDLAREAESFLI